jgi:predicted RNA-binding protein
MNYWLYITNPDNWEVTKKTNILGASKRFANALSRVKIGDKCLIYVMGSSRGGEIVHSKVVGEYSVASEVVYDSNKIFKSPTYSPSEPFSLRLKLEPLNEFRNPVDFKPLVAQLAFITNKQRYGLHLKGRVVVKIPENDYNLITSKARK